MAQHHLPCGQVTFLFTDIEGSTRLAQALGDGYRPVLIEHRRILHSVLTAAGGVHLSTEGDALFLAFADAATALVACADAQRALAAHQWPDPTVRPLVRMGLHTGTATPVGTEYTSAEVHRAARVAAAAHGGQVLCSAATAQATGLPQRRGAAPAGLPQGADPGADWLRDLGLHRLRGFDGRERLFQLVSPGLAGDFPRPRTQQESAHNLPAPVTAFLGRERELTELSALIGEHRLVTVVGTGGAGKTRLALQTAADRVDRYPDGVWFVDLAGVAEAGLLPTAVASTLGLRPEPGRAMRETLVEHVSRRRMLFLLDTCDAHPRAAAHLVSALLAAGGGVTVLATSREPLCLAGEVAWRTPPLSLVPARDGGPSEAVRFLLNRAGSALGVRSPVGPARPDPAAVTTRADAAARPVPARLATARRGTGRPADAVPTAALLTPLDAGPAGAGMRTGRSINALRYGAYPATRVRPAVPAGEPAADPAAVADLTRVAARLAGLPLAMELAAARLRVLTPAQLADRLDDVVGTLDAGRPAGGVADRHATLQATVDWSYRTLDARAARLLRWLSVFVGPIDLPAVQWLLDEDPLDPLAVLVDKSLVQAEPAAGGMTYRLLDPIRSYADRRLSAADEQAGARDRHLAWAGYALERAQHGPDGVAGTLSLYDIDPLAGELRAALRWATTGGSARAGLGLVLGMDQWWRERGLAREGRHWLIRLYQRLADSGEQVPPAELAAAYHLHSLHAGVDGEHTEELHYSRQAEQAARDAGSPGQLIRVLAGRGSALSDLGERDDAERTSRELIARAHAEGADADALFAVFCLAQLLWQRGALDEAADLLAIARPMEAARPAVRGRRTVDMLLGMVALARVDLVAAHDHLVVALRSRMAYGFHSRATETIAAFAVRSRLGGDTVTAARLFGASDTARARLRCSAGMYGPYWAGDQAVARATLGDADFDRAYAQGSELTLEEAVALALSIEHPDLTGDSVRFAVAG